MDTDELKKHLNGHGHYSDSLETDFSVSKKKSETLRSSNLLITSLFTTSPLAHTLEDSIRFM
jgi:hypothetical protein